MIAATIPWINCHDPHNVRIEPREVAETGTDLGLTMYLQIHILWNCGRVLGVLWEIVNLCV